MNKKVKKLSAAALLVGSLLSAATLRGTPTDADISFNIFEETQVDEKGDPLPNQLTLKNWNGLLTYFFINGQNDVTDVSTIQGLLNKGDTTFVNNAICSATVQEQFWEGSGLYSAAALGNNPSKLALGDYTAFAVLFDAKNLTDITKEQTQYLVLNLNQDISTYYADADKKVINGYSYQFENDSAATLASNESNWGTFGVVPEPTSGVMLLLGVAALALKRKRG